MLSVSATAFSKLHRLRSDIPMLNGVMVPTTPPELWGIWQGSVLVMAPQMTPLGPPPTIFVKLFLRGHRQARRLQAGRLSLLLRHGGHNRRRTHRKARETQRFVLKCCVFCCNHIFNELFFQLMIFQCIIAIQTVPVALPHDALFGACSLRNLHFERASKRKPWQLLVTCNSCKGSSAQTPANNSCSHSHASSSHA